MDSDVLLINNKLQLNLNKNVHIVAFGKAVTGMVRAAEKVLQGHVRSGVASIPSGYLTTFDDKRLVY